MSFGSDGFRFRRWEAAPSWPQAQASIDSSWHQALQQGEVIKDEAETLLLRSPLPDSRMAWWKLYRVPPRWRWRSFGARSRALREWRALRAFYAAGVPVVKPLAFGEDRRWGSLQASLLVTEEATQTTDLRQRLVRESPSSLERARWLRAAGKAVRHMHDTGFGHFRLQLRNLLGREGITDAEAEILFLDLPYACAFPRTANDRVRCMDLIDLAGSHSGLEAEDVRILLQAYAGSGTSPLEVGTLLAESRWRQKIRRITTYLFYVNTGHRPLPPPWNACPESWS
ncbi:MAG: hypothetical protein DWQ01_02525 [Planctomycetota bacterium]|nr:MAG: hypothetical protein DWQ01_02525 [Planctomycetota bacterium]